MIPLYRNACVSSRTSSHIFQLSEPLSLHSARIPTRGSNSSETGFLFALRSSGRRKKNPKVCPPVIFPANSISRKLPYSGVSVKTGSFHPVSDPSHSRSETYPCLPVFPVRTRQSFPEKALSFPQNRTGSLLRGTGNLPAAPSPLSRNNRLPLSLPDRFLFFRCPVILNIRIHVPVRPDSDEIPELPSAMRTIPKAQFQNHFH